MNPEQFAEFVLGILVFVMPSITSGALERIGAELAETPYNIYMIIRNKFRKNKDTKGIFEKFESNPENQEAQTVFREKLINLLKSDEAFASELGEGLIKANLGSIVVMGNQNQISQSIGKVASTLIEVKPEHAETIQFVLNIEGHGPGTLGEALQKLNPLFSPIPSINTESVRLENIYSQIEQVISEHANEIKFDIDLISKILEPAVHFEEKLDEEYPPPGRFLRNVVHEIGKELDKALIFDSKFATYESDTKSNFVFPVDEDGYRSEKTKDKLPMLQLAKEFNRDENYLFLVKNTTKWTYEIKAVEKNNNKSSFKLFSKSEKEKTRENEISYSIEYDGKPVIHHGEYHIEFDEQQRIIEWRMLERASKGSGERNDNSQKPESLSLPVSADVLGRFLRAISHDYISYIRYPNIIRTYIDSYNNKN